MKILLKNLPNPPELICPFCKKTSRLVSTKPNVYKCECKNRQDGVIHGGFDAEYWLKGKDFTVITNKDDKKNIGYLLLVKRDDKYYLQDIPNNKLSTIKKYINNF